MSSNDAVAVTADGSMIARADRRPRRLLWAGIVLIWLATGLIAAALGIIGTVVARLAWSLSECLGTPCPPKGPPPGAEILVVAAAVAVPALLIAGLVAFAPTRRAYTISTGAGVLLVAVLVVAHVQAGLLPDLPAFLEAVVVEPLDALAFIVTQMTDVLLASIVVIASVIARRRTSQSG